MTPEQRVRAAGAVIERIERLATTPTALARDAGIARRTLRLFLSGERWPGVGVRTSLEQALGWPLGELARQARDGIEALAAYTDDELRDELRRRGQSVDTL